MEARRQRTDSNGNLRAVSFKGGPKGRLAVNLREWGRAGVEASHLASGSHMVGGKVKPKVCVR